jgi:L-seryl-tRNA(Ser) seleniumtransferase
MTPQDPAPDKREQQDSRRRIPSVETILSSSELRPLLEGYGRDRVRDAIRFHLDELRRTGGEFDLSMAAAGVASIVEKAIAPSLRPVVNATGVLIHTNMGRAPLSRDHWSEAGDLLAGYSNLELDLDSGTRGSRQHHIEAIARELFGCESALLVNNNAAGILLVLSTLASGKEVIVSRGELVEIGGSFRIPDVIRQGGAILREVGTTNRTRASDFLEAIGSETGAVLSVHQSNFRIVGFTESPAVDELVGVAHASSIPLVIDEGSGRVSDLTPYGLPHQMTVRELLQRGADIVTCSTDKLIGSLQGGLILGRRAMLDRCRKHPLMRAVRPGKETFAAVTSALSAFAREAHEREIPLYRMLSASIADLRERAERIVRRTGGRIIESRSVVGGGTTPTETIPSVAIGIDDAPSTVLDRLRDHTPPVIGRIDDDLLLLDLRSVLPEQDTVLMEALATLSSAHLPREHPESRNDRR